MSRFRVNRALWSCSLASLAFVATLAALAYLNPARQISLDFGYEFGNIAASLAEGRGFSDPHATGSGATAWMAPLLCWIMAAVFCLLGVKTFAAALLLTVVKWVSLALTAGLLGQSGIAFMLLFWLGLAANLSWLASDLSDPWLVMLVAAWAVTGRTCRPAGWLAAISAPLVSPALAGALCVVLWLRREPKQLAALLVVGGLWCLRGGWWVGVWVPIKSNGGFEFYQSNVLSASGLLSSEVLLSHHPLMGGSPLRQQFRNQGEASFCRHYQQLAGETLMTQPAAWLSKVGRRLGNAFVCLQDPNDVRLGSELAGEDRWQLEEARLVLTTSRGYYWLCLSASEEQFLQQLSPLKLLHPEGVLQSWKAARSKLQRTQSSWSARLWGLCFAGLPTLALLLGWARGRGGDAAFREAALLYLLTLLPYLLISHYARYQLGLLPLQCWLVGLGLRPGNEP